MRLGYAIKFVDDMDKAVAFYRDTLGLEMKFQSPFWSEFATGETSLHFILHRQKTRLAASNSAFPSRIWPTFMRVARNSGLCSVRRPRRCMAST
ncbi:MAG TPA: VOC family protein [Sphingomicrobium sp.]|nr:VOC family protein [Sphingomicrobium sp.]